MAWVIESKHESPEKIAFYERESNPETRTLPTFWIDDYFNDKYVKLEGDHEDEDS